MKETIEQLTQAFGPAGYEENVREVLAELVTPLVDRVSTDALGNLVALRTGRPGGLKLMLAAHMDEIGFMVTHVDDGGFLRFALIGGGMPPQLLLGQRIAFANGTVGVVAAERFDKPGDLTAEKLFLDVGASSNEDLPDQISVGSVATFHREFSELGGRLASKAMDDRVGCAVLVEALRRLDASPHDLYFTFTAQEEVGLRGARTAAYSIEPDMGIAIDITGTGDTPKARRMDVALGGGAAVKIKDSSIVCHPAVVKLLLDTAREAEVQVQAEVLEYGGTDAGAIQLSRGGVPSGGISIPCRYAHTPSEMVDMGDVEACVNLVVALARRQIEL